MIAVRCDNGILFGYLEDGVLEVKCKSDRCADRQRGVVVIHRFDVVSGDLLATSRYRDPATRKEGGRHASVRVSPVRNP